MTKFNDNTVNQICELISNGETINIVCKKVGISKVTFYQWVKENKNDFANKVEKAKLNFKMNASDEIKTTAINKLQSILDDGFIITKDNSKTSIITHKKPIYDEDDKLIGYKIIDVETIEHKEKITTNLGIPQWVFDKIMLSQKDLSTLINNYSKYSYLNLQNDGVIEGLPVLNPSSKSDPDIDLPDFLK